MAFAKNRLDDGLTFLAARFEFFSMLPNKKGSFYTGGGNIVV
jgi:hypothetical protein